MITKLKWKNHNILGNLDFDFTKKDGTSYNTIVLADENGVRKTSILETSLNREILFCMNMRRIYN